MANAYYCCFVLCVYPPYIAINSIMYGE